MPATLTGHAEGECRTSREAEGVTTQAHRTAIRAACIRKDGRLSLFHRAGQGFGPGGESAPDACNGSQREPRTDSAEAGEPEPAKALAVDAAKHAAEAQGRPDMREEGRVGRRLPDKYRCAVSTPLGSGRVPPVHGNGDACRPPRSALPLPPTVGRRCTVDGVVTRCWRSVRSLRA